VSSHTIKFGGPDDDDDDDDSGGVVMMMTAIMMMMMIIMTDQPLTEMSTKNIFWRVKAAGAYG
jgi:hypothetical protein